MSTPALPWYFVEDCAFSADSVRLEEAVQPAVEYNTGRTHTRTAPDADQLARPGAPWPATDMRTMSILTGMWIERGSGCHPSLGEHLDRCPHRDEDWIAFTLRGLARETLGRDDGRALRSIAKALDNLASRASRVLFFDAATRQYVREVSTLGSFQMLRDLPSYARPAHASPDATCRWAFTVPLKERLLAGGYQRIPAELVRGLNGSAWHVWQRLLDHPAIAACGVCEVTVGPDATLPLSRLGLAGINRPSNVRKTLERAAARGNALQDRYRMKVLDAATGGLKVRVERVRVSENVDRVSPRTQPRVSENAIPLNNGSPDDSPDIEKTPSSSTEQVEAVNGGSDGDTSWEPASAPSSRSPVEVTGARSGPSDRWRERGVPGAGAQGVTLGPTQHRVTAIAERRRRGETTVNDRVTAIADRLARLWGRDVTPRQWQLLAGIEDRGLKAGCDAFDHCALVEDAAYQIGKGGSRIDWAMGLPDALQVLIDHDRAVHPPKPRKVATPKATPQAADVDVLVRLLPADLARRARRLALAGVSANEIGRRLGLVVGETNDLSPDGRERPTLWEPE